MRLDELETPVPVVDIDRMEANILRLQSYLEFIPTDFAFGILVTAFDQVAMGLAPGHRFKRGLFGVLLSE